MKKISKADLNVLKAGLKYYNDHGRDDKDTCIDCPMSSHNNRLHVRCYEFIELLGGEDIFRGARDEGYDDQHNVIKYMINKSSSVRGIKI